MDIYKLFFVLLLAHICDGLYLITDYVMDHTTSSTFGGSCGTTIKDDCLFINAGTNVFGLGSYGNNIVDCIITLDASIATDARYQLAVREWAVQDSDNCSADNLVIYDGAYDEANPMQNAVGVYCGSTQAPNLTDPNLITGRFVTFRFSTNAAIVAKGFKVMATRTAPPPCDAANYIHCTLEDRCINKNLKCDGTRQCLDGVDEIGCSGMDEFVGSLLTFGLANLIGLGVMIFAPILILSIIGCICCCCKKKKKKQNNIQPITINQVHTILDDDMEDVGDEYAPEETSKLPDVV